MARNLKIRDLTLRDGQQSSFATRMSQAQVDRCLPYYKDANFYAMEVWGGAVPDSVMRYLNENPWTRLETIHKAVGNVSKLTALSRGRNLFGYAPYPDDVIDGFCRNSIESGLGIMRIFDALNDVDNVKSTVKYVKQYGGIADCAVCYTVDPKYPEPGFFAKLMGKKGHEQVFTDAYFLDKAKQMAALGADMITIKDMSGLIPPRRVATLVKLFKKNIDIPVDFHTHCTPGYGLASVLAAIIAGVDVVDTNCWYFAEGTGAPAIELVHVFCKKLGVDTGVNMEAVAKINTRLREIRKELNQSVFGTEKPEPKPFNPLTDTLPAEIDALFDKAIKAAQADDEAATIDACRKIEAYFGFPAPNELVQKAEIPGGMYSNMVAQLKQLKAEDILPRAMELIPSVRLAAGLPPLVTPTSQIVGAQAVNCALDEKAGRPMYTNKSSQFVGLVKGEYGHTPVKIDPEFRFKICGVREETPYDTSKYQMQPNPEASRSRRRETRRRREGGPAARTLPAGRQELPDGHEGQGLRRFEARGTQGRGEEGRGECCGRHYGQYRYGAAARPHHRIQGEGRRYGKSGSGNRCSRSHEDGELRDDRLRRHRQADSGASRRQRGHRRRAGRDRIVPSGLFIRRKAARVLRTAFLIADSVNIAIFVPSINLTSDLWHFSKNSRSLPSRET